MTTLSDAIDYFDGKKRKVPPEGHFPIVLEAARRYANLYHPDTIERVALAVKANAEYGRDAVAVAVLDALTEDTE